MNPKAGLINAGLVLFSFIVLTTMPTFGYAKNVYQPDNTRVSSGVVGATELAQLELNPNAAFGWSIESSGGQSRLRAEVLREGLMLFAQKDPKHEGKKPKTEAGKTGGKGSDASKEVDDDDEDEDDGDEDEDDDDGDTGKNPATDGDKAPEKKKS